MIFVSRAQPLASFMPLFTPPSYRKTVLLPASSIVMPSFKERFTPHSLTSSFRAQSASMLLREQSVSVSSSRGSSAGELSAFGDEISRFDRSSSLESAHTARGDTPSALVMPLKATTGTKGKKNARIMEKNVVTTKSLRKQRTSQAASVCTIMAQRKDIIKQGLKDALASKRLIAESATDEAIQQIKDAALLQAEREGRVSKLLLHTTAPSSRAKPLASTKVTLKNVAKIKRAVNVVDGQINVDVKKLIR